MKDRNENRAGYKKTKVGWIPKEWNILKLQDAATINPNTLIDKTPQDYCFYYIDLSSVKEGVVQLPPQKVSFGKAPCRARRIVNTGDVLLATVRPNLKGFAYIGFDAKNLVCSTGFAVLRARNSIDGLYIYYSLYSQYTSRYLYGCVVGSGYPALNNSDVKWLRMPSPPLVEQKKIAKILSTWDEAIEQTSRLIDAKMRRKKALMQQLLTGKKRLPGFAKSSHRIPYRFFGLPEDWECPQIGKIAHECTERNGHGEKMTVLSCSKHVGFVESEQYFGKQVFSKDTSNYKVIKRGWFGYPSNHIEEGSIGLLTTHDLGIVSPIYTVFQTNTEMCPEYLYALFKTETYRHIFAVSTNASVDRRGSLRWREFSRIQVPLPSLEEQRRIADVLSTADDEINNLEEKLSALEKQKRGLMQKLLTGEIRVKV